MPNIIITGKLGGGKGLSSVGLMRKYLAEGRPVATNMDIFPEHFKDKHNRSIRIMRVPDRPTETDLVAIGSGNDTADVTRNGLLMLDEGATWLNSRNWNERGRKGVIDFFLHARKRGWDVGIQIQSMNALDAQIRDSICELHGHSVKVRKVWLPVISPIIRSVLGKYPDLPTSMQYHKLVINNIETGLKEEQLRFFGNEFYAYYDTKQIFREDYPNGPHSLLTPWHLVGRYGPQPVTWRQRFGGLIKLPLLLILWVSACFDYRSRCYYNQQVAVPMGWRKL